MVVVVKGDSCPGAPRRMACRRRCCRSVMWVRSLTRRYVVPLWQVEQVPVTLLVVDMLAFSQLPPGLWHASQVLVVVIWVVPLPVAACAVMARVAGLRRGGSGQR